MSVFVFTSNKGKLSEFQQAFNNEKNILGLKDLLAISNSAYVEPIENSDYFLSNAFVKLFLATKYVLNNLDKNKFKNIQSIIVDDSGLCVPTLGFLPGVHSAIFAGEPKDDKKNRIKLAKEIENCPNSILVNNEKRLPAFFVCFLLEISIIEIEKLVSLKNLDYIAANTFVSTNIIELEKSLLGKVDLNKTGGFFTESICLSSFHQNMPKNIKINIHYGYCNGEVSSKEQNLILGAGHGYDSQFYSQKNKALSFASISLEEKNKQSHRALAMEAMRTHFKD